MFLFIIWSEVGSYYLLKQLANQLATSLLTTCNRLVINKVSQGIQMVLLSRDNKSVARCQLLHFFQSIKLHVLGLTGTVVLGSCAFSVGEGELQSVE